MRNTVICMVLSMLVTQQSTVTSEDSTVSFDCNVYDFENVTKLLIDCDSARMIKFFIKKWPRIPQEFIEKTQSVHTIDVTSQNIRALENKDFCEWHGLSSIIADMNDIPTLPSRMLSNCRHLKTLSLTKSNITEIYDDAFHGLSVLIELDLSSNQISSLSEDVFKPLTSLKTLRLSYNNITVINNDHFAFNPKLELLDISYNTLNVIGKGAFWKLKQLLTLELSVNPQLNDIDLSEMDRLKAASLNNASLTSLRIPTNVVKVFANFNQISTVTIDANGVLQELYLNHNLFRNLEGLSQADKLNILDISDNNITDVNFTHLMGTQIQTLIIGKNPIKSFNVTDMVNALPELRDIQISFQTLNKRTILDLDNETRKRHIRLLNVDSSQDQSGANSFTIPPVTPFAAKDTASITFNSTTTSSPNVPSTPNLIPDSLPSGSKDTIITELVNRIRKLESSQSTTSEVHDEMLAHVSNLRIMIVCTILAFSLFVLFQIGMFVSTKYNGCRVPIRNVFANGVNGIANHRRQRNMNNSMDPIMEEVL